MIKRSLIVALSLAPHLASAQPDAPAKVQLTSEEQDTLEIGYITDEQASGGGVVATVIGLGLGHAIQGRWSDRGWIFTIAEPIAFGMMIYGFSKDIQCTELGGPCQQDQAGSLLFIGAAALVGLRLWEALDAWVVPSLHNERYRAVQLKLGTPMAIVPYVAPSTGGAIAGIALRF